MTRTHTSIFQSVGGQLSYVLSQMLVLAALARFEGVEATGAFGVAMAIATPVFLLANMGARTGLSTDAGRLFALPVYAGLVLVTGLLGLILSVTIGNIALSSEEARSLLLIIAAMKAAESVTLVCYGAFQLESRMHLVARSLTLRGWVSAGVFILLLANDAPVAGAFVSQLVVWLAVLMLHDYPLASRLLEGSVMPPRFQPRAMLSLARINIPLSVSGFLNAVTNNLPRLILERYFGLAAVGIFTVIAYFMQAGTMVINAVNQALLGRFAKMRLEQVDPAKLSEIARALIVVAVGFSVIGVLIVYLFGDIILVKGFGPEFIAGSTLFLLVAFSLTAKLFGIVPQAIVHANRKFGLFLAFEALLLVLAFTLLMWLVPLLGLTGAGISIIVVAIFRLVFLSITALRMQRGNGA